MPCDRAATMGMTKRCACVLLVVIGSISGCAAEPDELSSSSSELQKLTGTPKAPCNRSDAPCVDLYVTGHPDDDLLFMNPDIMSSIRSGNRVIVVVKNGGSTAFDDPNRVDEARYWLNRERGILNAYAYMARGDSGAFATNSTSLSLSGGTIPSGYSYVTTPGQGAYLVAGVKLPRFDIQATGGNLVTIMFMRFADGGTENLWWDGSGTYQVPLQVCPNPIVEGQDFCAGGASLGAQTVTRPSLINFYKSVMEQFAVTSVSVLDATDINITQVGGPAQFGGFTDNGEHVYTAKFAVAAATLVQAATNRSISIRSSRGYSLDLEEPNLAIGESEQYEKQRAFLYYAMFDQAALYPSVGGAPYASCTSPCASEDPNRPGTHAAEPTTANRMTGVIPFGYSSTYFSSPDTHVNPLFYGPNAWQARKYTTRTLVGTEPVVGRIQTGAGLCLAVNVWTPTFASCASAPAWTVTLDHRIQIGLGGTAYCLTVSQTANPPTTTPETVSLQPCGSTDGSQTMFMFANGQIRTPQARCLTQGGSAVRSEDCQAPFDTAGMSSTALSASTSEPGFNPEYAVDGNLNTRWSSQAADDQYIIFDLGEPMPIHGFRLNWETAYGRDYEIQLSNNGLTYTTCAGCTVTNGNGGVDDVALTTPTTARYVRMHGIHRGTQWGFSLWEISLLRPGGKPIAAQDWTLLFGPIQLASSQWSNSTIYDNSDIYYRTFSIVNRNVCMRLQDRVYCLPTTGGLSLGSPQAGPADFADTAGWNTSATGSTVRGVWSGADPGGSNFACGRGYYGVSCTNGLFSADYSTGNGWSAAQYYETIRYPDLFDDGRVHVCGRGYYGISCALNQGNYLASSLLLTSQFSTGMGWDHPTNGYTIQFGDINGDGRLDVCGRSDGGIRCAIMARDSAYYTNGRDWSFDNDRSTALRRDFGNSDPVVNWASSRSYYGSIRLVDVNRDGLADVCGRGPLGVYCAFSNGTHFEAKRLVLPDLNNSAGWGTDNTGGTLSFGDLNGNKRMDLCARGINGVVCSEGY
jgi:hypothetical protein